MGVKPYSPFALSLPLFSLPIPPFPSHPLPFPSPPFPSLRSRTPDIWLEGLGECCELPQWGLQPSPSRDRMRCILALKYGIWWQ